MLANIAKFKNRKEVLNTIFLLKCGAVIASCYNTKKSCLRKTSSILNNYLYYNISKEKRREQD
nr:MAG TPA: hypothetical protein [Caudoviricetes sp.]